MCVFVASFERARQVLRGLVCTVLCIVFVFLVCWYDANRAQGLGRMGMGAWGSVRVCPVGMKGHAGAWENWADMFGCC